MLIGEVRHPVTQGRHRSAGRPSSLLARFANAPAIRRSTLIGGPKPHSKNTGCTVWFAGDRLAIMGEAWEIRNSIQPKLLCEELLRSLRESLAHLDGLRMVDPDDAAIVALKQSICDQIQDLEQRICS